MLGTVDPVDVRHPAGGDDHQLRLLGEHVLRLGVAVEMHDGAEALDLRRQPLDDAEQVLAPGSPRREHDLPARLAGGLEDDDLVPAKRRDPGRLQPGRPRPHHDHLPLRTGAGLHHVRHRPLASRRGVVQAQRVAPDIDAVDAVAGTDAGSNPLLLAPHHLRDDVGVRHVGTGHRHHVDQALAHAVLGRREIRDAGGVKDGEPGLAFHLAPRCARTARAGRPCSGWPSRARARPRPAPRSRS